LAIVALAAGAIWLLEPVLGNSVPLTVFLLAVTASAWIGGGGPGVFATLVSLVAAYLLSVNPNTPVPITPAGYSLRLVLFGTAGMAISLINETRRRAAP